MNDMTLFLAQIFGPVLGLVGLGILVSRDVYFKAFKDFKNITFGTVLMNMAMIALGVVLVMKHFLWGSVPEVLISVVALAFLFKGVMLAVFPKYFDRCMR